MRFAAAGNGEITVAHRIRCFGAREKVGVSEGATGTAMDGSVRAREAENAARHGEVAWRRSGEQLPTREGEGDREKVARNYACPPLKLRLLDSCYQAEKHRRCEESKGAHHHLCLEMQVGTHWCFCVSHFSLFSLPN